MSLTVDFERLKATIHELSMIGRSGDGGIYRMAFSDQEMEAKKWLQTQLRESGFQSGLDGALNVIGRYSGKQHKNKPSVIVGSHIDTVPNAGALDGALGVLIGLECLRRLKEENRETRWPIELVAFSDEEGRFGGMFGSRALSGQLDPGIIDEAMDLDGVLLRDILTKLHGNPLQALDAARPAHTVKGYLELHIEQGPVLDSEKTSIGVVSDITGLFKWQVTMSGTANHAGTTPMEMRRDAFMGLADFAHEIPRIIDENGSDMSRMTIGNVALFPGSANTVPGKVEFSIDARDVSESVMNDLKDASRKALSAISRRRQLQFDFVETSMIKPVACEPKIQDMIIENAQKLDLKYKTMPSGAAHDAQMISKISPIGMIFVPSKNGVSHSPHEWTDWHHLENGANLMLNVLLDMANADD